MTYLVDKTVLAFLCFCLSFLWPGDLVIPVASLLTAIIISCLCQYFEEKKRLCDVLMIFYGLLCIILPNFCAALPLVCYEAGRQKVGIPLCVFAASLLFSLFRIEAGQAAVYFVLSVGSLLLLGKTSSADKTKKRLEKIRDSEAELAIRLEEKNRALMEKQDYELYLATLKERNRIAREIHDNVGHMLSRSILQAGALLAVTDKDSVTYDGLTGLKSTLDSAMDMVRDSVHDLHDESLDLSQAAKEAVKPLTGKYNVSLEAEPLRNAPGKVKLCFISIIREAVSNFTRHSSGDSFSVTIREHPGFYQLIIKDNGKSITVNPDGKGIGLANMEERVRSLNGQISITTGNGFQIFVIVKKENLS